MHGIRVELHCKANEKSKALNSNEKSEALNSKDYWAELYVINNFTITAEIHVRSLANFYCQYADRHMNLKLMGHVSELGSITSRCSGKEPALLPRRHGWTREDSFVSLSQSVNRPQIFVGHKLSRQLELRPGMADDVEMTNGMRKNFRDN